jgi:hypothetical protein
LAFLVLLKQWAAIPVVWLNLILLNASCNIPLKSAEIAL